MNRSAPTRVYLFGGLFLLLLAILISRWISDWGLVTLHVKDEPLGKVLASIASQGHTHAKTSLDSTLPVSLDVDKVTPAVALDILSGRVDADVRVVYLAAPTKSALNAAITSLETTGKVADWTPHFYQGPSAVGVIGTDPSTLELKIEGPDNQLPLLLDQAAQKTGVMTGTPQDWSPSVSKLPPTAPAGKVIKDLVGSAHGQLANFFFLTKQEWRNRRPQAEGSPQAEGGGQPQGGDPFAGMNGQRSRMNPEWREARVQAQIKQLPPEAQAAAIKDVEEMKAVFKQMQGLSQEERRAKWEELMSNPDFADRMESRRAVRQQSQTAEQRIDRGISYLERRQSVMSGQGGTSVGGNGGGNGGGGRGR